MPPEKTTTLDATQPHAASPAAEGPTQAMSCETSLASDTVAGPTSPQAMAAGGSAGGGVGASRLGGESRGVGGSVSVCSPFASTSWQEANVSSGSSRQQAQQQQEVQRDSESVIVRDSASTPAAPATQRPLGAGSRQDSADTSASGHSSPRILSQPAQPLPAAQASSPGVTRCTTRSSLFASLPCMLPFCESGK